MLSRVVLWVLVVLLCLALIAVLWIVIGLLANQAGEASLLQNQPIDFEAHSAEPHVEFAALASALVPEGPLS
jgi:hypothetical protein